MKYKTLLLSILLLPASLLIQNFTSSSPEKSNHPAPQPDFSGKITLSGAYALYPMVVRWGEEFQKLHPGVKIDVQGGGAGKGMNDALSGTVAFGMVSREIAPEEVAKGAFGIAVCKDAVIPTINPNNPY